MSLLRPIIRMCAVAALRDKTWAETRVYDSDMTPFAEAVAGKAAAPYVVVYTDTDDRMAPGAEVYNNEKRMLSIVVEMGIAASTKTGTGGLAIQFAATDQGMEFAVDVLETQVYSALFGDPHSDWGNLLKKIVYRVRRVPSRRGGQAQKGIRFAARRTTFVCSTLDDPTPGQLLADNHPIRQFIALASSSTAQVGMNETAGILSKLIETEAAPTWRQAQAFMGMSTEAAQALNADVPLPWPNVEVPPLDWHDSNEFTPPFNTVDAPQDTTI